MFAGLATCQCRKFGSLMTWIIFLAETITDWLATANPKPFEFSLKNLLLSIHFFFYHLAPHVYSFIWHLKNSSASLWSQEPTKLWQQWVAWNFSWPLSSGYAIFAWIWTYKTHDITVLLYLLFAFLQSLTWTGKRPWQIQRWLQDDPNFSSSNYSPPNHSIPVSREGLDRVWML